MPVTDDTGLPVNVALPSSLALRWPTLQAIQQIGGSGSISEIEAKVSEICRFTEQQQGVPHLHGTTSELSYRQAWARTYLKNELGALANLRGSGIWSVTDLGRALDEAAVNASRPRRRRPIPATNGHETTSTNLRDTSDDAIGQTENGLAGAWQDQLLRVLFGMAPDAFERLCQRLLREADFTSVTVTGRSGDGGIDGVGVMRLSLLSFPVLFQCKRFQGSVGAAIVRDFRGAMVGRADKGLLITTGTFTSEARREATRDGAPPIDLIDGMELCALLKRLDLGVQTRQVEQVTIDDRWFASI